MTLYRRQGSRISPWKSNAKRQKDRTLKDELPRSVGAQYATGDQWRNNPRKNAGMEPKQKHHLVVDGTGEVEWFYEDLQDLIALTPKKDVLFIIGDWIAKVGSQETPGVTGKFGLGVQNEAGRRLIEFCQGNTLVIATPSSSNTREDSTHGHHHNQIDYIPCSQRWRSSIQSAKTRPGTDCGSDHELLIAKFRLKLKEVGITTGPFRYELNQIPYDYTVEVRNRFKGLDLIECLMNYEWRFMMIQWMLVI